MYLISIQIYLFNNIILRVFITRCIAGNLKLSIICTVFFLAEQRKRIYFLIFFASFFYFINYRGKMFRFN